VNPTTTTAQIRLSRVSPAYWRITFDNPPLNVMGPQFVQEFREVVTAIEDDEQVKVVVFDSAVEGYFLNHSDSSPISRISNGYRRGPRGSRRGRTSWCA